MNGKFMIRVYALIIHSDLILVCDENYEGFLMTKFPGGGVEYGEGLLDALKREIYEELNDEVTNAVHFYTTDFFQASTFHKETQLISVYYLTTIKNLALLSAQKSIIPNYPKDKHSRYFRWIPLNELSPDFFTFPIDKHVANLLIKQSKIE